MMSLEQFLAVLHASLDYVRCSRCGKRVSQLLIVPDTGTLRGLVIRAYVECPECVQAREHRVH